MKVLALIEPKIIAFFIYGIAMVCLAFYLWMTKPEINNDTTQ